MSVDYDRIDSELENAELSDTYAQILDYISDSAGTTEEVAEMLDQSLSHVRRSLRWLEEQSLIESENVETEGFGSGYIEYELNPRYKLNSIEK